MLMGAIEAGRGAEVVTKTVATLAVTEMETTAIALPEATFTEAELGVELAPNPPAMIDITGQELMGVHDLMEETETTKDLEIDVIDQWSGGARQVRKSVPKAKLQSHNLLKTNVIGGLFSYNSLPPVSEQRSLFNSSRKLGLSKKLRL